MPRPRVHDLDRLLDTAERLVAQSGAGTLTVRGLATAAGVPNGTIYHAFGSVGALLGQVWLRAARDVLDLQTELADAAAREGTPADAVVAAADAPAVFACRRPSAARMLLTVKRDALLGPQLPTELADDLLALDTRVVALLVRLAEQLWGRRDAAAVEVLTTCVVDLPTALLRRPLTADPPQADPDVRARLAVAVRAVLSLAPPSARTRPSTPKD
ncbi:TetR/AcrR family transcriptional regulator [Prauserella cavernicola]|uniref:TetR family transcriptional regulator n=1 Tax=Prauserella cavernicola TaxID=2800127 RepID=A0A934QX48_9PSEU|nr:TetR/AcrR family transcriptional regulator [Prauserella cavernicola]MBK1787772.1 TetR family transcriptional regulator [Prauserella cavernicola]